MYHMQATTDPLLDLDQRRYDQKATHSSPTVFYYILRSQFIFVLRIEYSKKHSLYILDLLYARIWLCAMFGDDAAALEEHEQDTIAWSMYSEEKTSSPKKGWLSWLKKD